VTKRMYIPVRETGVLAVNGEGLWTAIVTIPVAELDPFVRTTWLAEVRYPAEPPIPPGMAPLPVAGGVEPVWSTVGASAEGVWSDPSLVAVSLLIPPDGPAAPAAPTLTVEANGSTTVTMTGLPSAHPAAIAPYHLEVYRGTPGTASKLVGTKDLAGDGLTWTDPTPAPAGVHYDLVVVDPIGRRSPPTRA